LFNIYDMRQPIVVRFGLALRRKRNLKGITQSALAALTGVSRSYISEVECGRQNISLEKAELLAQAVGCRLADLLKEEDLS
jgi:transcriptional regulator with XRE-family HTH domain